MTHPTLRRRGKPQGRPYSPPLTNVGFRIARPPFGALTPGHIERVVLARLWTGVGGGIQRRDGCQQVGRAPRDATSGISCRMFWALDPCTSFRFTARPKRTTAWAASRVPFWQSRVPFWPVHGSRAVHRNHDTSKSDIFGTRVASRVPFFKKMVHEYRWALVALAKRRM